MYVRNYDFDKLVGASSSLSKIMNLCDKIPLKIYEQFPLNPNASPTACIRVQYIYTCRCACMYLAMFTPITHKIM